MRRPLDRRVIAFCRPRLVPTRLAVALAAEMFVTTENEAIEISSLKERPASVPASERPWAVHDRGVIGGSGGSLSAARKKAKGKRQKGRQKCEVRSAQCPVPSARCPVPC